MNIKLDREINAIKYHRRIFSELQLADQIPDEYYMLITGHLRDAEIAIETLFRETKQNEYTLRT